MGKRLLAAGIAALIVGIVLLFFTNSILLGVTFVLSILLNVAGVTLLTDPKDD